MDTYTYSTTTNSGSSSSSSYSEERRSGKPPQAYRAALHAVRKTPTKYVITKKSIAPMPPVPPKIYKVDRVDFRDVVQSLTAAPGFQRRRLQEVAPPPLSLSPPQHSAMSPLGFSLSPSSLAWCSSMLFSPQTLSSFDPTSTFP
ncbi:hypothetical protein ACS0TY_029262 [Phlomoides rotata]